MFEESDLSEDDLCFVFSTSGTTGFSKQVPYTHRQFLSSALCFGVCMGIKPDSRFFLDRSLGWLGGFPGMYAAFGATRVLTDLSKGLPEDLGEHILRIMNDEDIDCGGMIPPESEALLKKVSSGKTLKRRLRTIGIGGMPLTKKCLRPLGVFSDSMNFVYGSTEVGFASLLRLQVDTHFEDYCVGVPFEGCELKVVNKDLNEVPTGVIGDVIIKSRTGTPKYLNQPEKTQSAVTKDGFFKIEDNGYKKDNGMLYVLGRKMNAIHKGIFIHYPGWIESRIFKCQGIEHVIVLDVPDPLLHHEICACVILSDGVKLTEQELRDFCEHQFMVDSKSDMSAVPKYYVFFDSYPRNLNGKITRDLLRKEACKRLNISLEG